MTSAVLLLGAGCGAGLCLLLLAALPRPVPLDKALAKITRPPDLEPSPTTSNTEPSRWAVRLGRPAAGLLTRAGLPLARTRRDLVTLDKPVGVHLAEQATAAVAGLLLPSAAAFVLAVAGLHVGITVPIGVALLGAVAGLAAPEAVVRTEAARRRASIRHNLGIFLNLVEVSLAGGAGVDQALDDAASISRGPAATDLRHALDQARLARVPPWDTLASLGRRTGVEQLEQLAATVGLAGVEGAKVRASLRSRAQALRTRQLTDTDAEASAATERMSLPVVALFAGFLVLIGFPAVTAVLTGL
jgi:tight adherence protein C